MNELSHRDLTNIKTLHDIWIAKELAGHESELVDLCIEDVRWLCPDGLPMRGKEEIRKYLAQQRVKVLAVDASDLSIQGSGSVAYLVSDYTTRYLSEGHSQIEHEAKGTHLWILQKENDEWRVAIVTWSSW